MLPKAARLVILCCFLIHFSIIGSDFALYHTVNKDGVLAFLISQSVAYLLYPLLGWLADVYFTRYKFILFSFMTMIVSSILLSVVSAIFVNFIHERGLFILGGIALAVCLIAMGMFESTATQFGMDQMLEASSNQLSIFIHWYYWSCGIGRIIALNVTLMVILLYSPS